MPQPSRAIDRLATRNNQFIDTAWGTAGFPLLPESLRALWSDRELPAKFREELGVVDDRSFHCLHDRCLRPGQVASRALHQYLGQLVTTEARRIAWVRVVPTKLPEGLTWPDVLCSHRIRSAVFSGVGPEGPAPLAGATFGELSLIPQLGPRSVLELACMIEAAIEGTKPVAEETTWSDPPEMRQARHALQELATRNWVHLIRGDDPRFRDFLPSSRDSLAEVLNASLGQEAPLSAAMLALSWRIPELEARLNVIDHTPLDRALADFFTACSGQTGVRAQSLMERMHWTGAATPLGASEAATMLGVCQQRARQLVERIKMGSVPKGPAYLPALDQALGVVRCMVPAPADAVATALASFTREGTPFHPASLRQAALDMHRGVEWSVIALGEQKMVVWARNAAHLQLVHQATALAAKELGIGHVGKAMLTMTASSDPQPEVERFEELVQLLPTRQWLGDGWFRSDEGPGGAIWRHTLKMLAASAPLTVGVLREGIIRALGKAAPLSLGGEGIPAFPPIHVLFRWYETHPAFVLRHGDRVEPVAPWVVEDILTPRELLLVRLLKESSRMEKNHAFLLQEWESRHGGTGLGQLLAQSAFVEHVGYGQYRLRK